MLDLLNLLNLAQVIASQPTLKATTQALHPISFSTNDNEESIEVETKNKKGDTTDFEISVDDNFGEYLTLNIGVSAYATFKIVIEN